MEPRSGIRLDKWLWQARFFRTRSLAARMVEAGRVRVNGARATKPAATVRPGDVLTIAQPQAVRVVRVRGPGERRGPAAEAALLFEDIPEGGTVAPPGGPDARGP